MKNTKRGFTLIELLVVIAIIGILSATVLAALGSARNKANDVKISGQLSQMRSASEIFASSNNSYTGLCAPGSSDTSGMYALMQGANYPGGVAPQCAVNSTGTGWAMQKPLVSNTALFFCVDSLGQATTTTGSSINVSAAASTDTKCGA